MSDINTTYPEAGEVTSTTEDLKAPEEYFFPSGAIAFFVILVTLCIAFWFAIYWLMIGRI